MPRNARVLPLWILPNKMPGLPVEVSSFWSFSTVFLTHLRRSGPSPRSSAIVEYILSEGIVAGIIVVQGAITKDFILIYEFRTTKRLRDGTVISQLQCD